jgi:hypothetical protein
MAPIDVRKGMPSVELSRGEFERRYRNRFADPAFKPLQRELDAITAAAWDGYTHSRKSPLTQKAGPGFADPDYDISIDWLAARDAILAAQRRHDAAGERPRILLINGSSRSNHTCPGEMSKTWRLVKMVEPVFLEWDLPSTSSTSQGSVPNSAGRFIPANPASRPRWRCVTGRAVAIRIMRGTRPTTG